MLENLHLQFHSHLYVLVSWLFLFLPDSILVVYKHPGNCQYFKVVYLFTYNCSHYISVAIVMSPFYLSLFILSFFSFFSLAQVLLFVQIFKKNLHLTDFSFHFCLYHALHYFVPYTNLRFHFFLFFRMLRCITRLLI